MESRGEMIKTPVSLQDLRRRIYVKAKAEPSWRFWGMYVHVCKMETLREAYRLAKANNGAAGVDGVTFAEIEASGVEAFLAAIRRELVEETYRPQRVRKVEIPKKGEDAQWATVSFAAHRVPHRDHQPHPSGMGELLRGGEFGPLLLTHPQLGRAEDTATPGPLSTAPRLRLEAMETTMAL